MPGDAKPGLLTVRLTPRSARDELAGWKDGVLQARVKAPPVDGKANSAVCDLVARELGIAPGRIAIASGHGGRTKRLRVEGMTATEARARLGG